MGKTKHIEMTVDIEAATKNFAMEIEHGERSLVYKGPKPKTVLEAFVISLAKWDILSRVRSEIRSDGGPETCGLCMLFNAGYGQDNSCLDCPIYLYSKGARYCDNTPYEKLLSMIENEEAVSADVRVVSAEEIGFLWSVYEWYYANPYTHRIYRIKVKNMDDGVEKLLISEYYNGDGLAEAEGFCRNTNELSKYPDALNLLHWVVEETLDGRLVPVHSNV